MTIGSPEGIAAAGATGNATLAAPSEAAQEAPAWGLAYLPLVATIFYGLAAAAGINLGLVSMAMLAGAAGLVVLDKRDLARSGRLPRTLLPSTT